MKKKGFFLTNFSIRNQISFLVLAVLICLYGIQSFNALPKEDNPEIKIPYIFVSTMYSGASAKDIENNVTKPIEKHLKSLADVKTVQSVSLESFSSVTVQFNPDVDVEVALQKVKDKVNLAESDLPADAEDPVVEEFSFEKQPIMTISLSGEKSLVRLKQMAEKIQDEIEAVSGVLDTSLVGGLEREIQIDVDKFKLDNLNVSFDDIVNALKSENLSLPGGKLDIGQLQYLLRIPSEYKEVSEFGQTIIKTEFDKPIMLKDISQTTDGFKEVTSVSRYQLKPSVSLLVTRRAGENLIELSNTIQGILKDAQGKIIPNDVKVSIIGDRSEMITMMLNELVNSILTGMLLVILVLLFFLGIRNAIFVGIAIPMSMLISFCVVRFMGMTLNMVVLFSLILALGMLVDNGIVIVENIYRHREEGKGLVEASRIGTGEVALPVISSTLTTLAAFAPLLFWPGIMGEFMGYLPKTLIIALASSLFVALCITPVLCSKFMPKTVKSKKEVNELDSQAKLPKALNAYRGVLQSIIKKESPLQWKTVLKIHAVFFVGFMILPMVLGGAVTNYEYSRKLSGIDVFIQNLDYFGTPIFLCFIGFALIYFCFKTVNDAYSIDPKKLIIIGAVLSLGLFIPLVDQAAGIIRLLCAALVLVFLALAIGVVKHSPARVKRMMFVYSFLLFFIASINSVGFLNTDFFPETTPEHIDIRLEMPEGTKIDRTNKVIADIERIVSDVQKTTNGKNIRHFVTNVGARVGDPFALGNDATNYAQIGIDFYKSEDRNAIAKELGVDVSELDPFETVRILREKIKQYPVGQLSLALQANGPPTGKPIFIEISGDDFDKIKSAAENVKRIVKNVDGAINVSDSLKGGGPEVSIEVDKKKAAYMGVSSMAIGSTVRSVIHGVEATTFRENDEEYDVLVRFKNDQRSTMLDLDYIEIPGKDGKRVPLSQVATIKTSEGQGSINRVDFKKVINVESEISKESKRTAEQVKKDIEAIFAKKKNIFPEGVTYKFRGEQEEQAESMKFLGEAFSIALFLIGIILISQFNSLILPSIILFSVLLSFIGVVLGLFIAPLIFEFKLETSRFIIIMTGVGIVSLAGVVVNNAIVLIDYIQLLRKEGYEKVEAVVLGGIRRFRPVLLTAVTTVFGLIPMSTGVSLDFTSRVFFIFPKIITGSSSAEWWAPLSNAVIFGLVVSTMLTLLMVPIFYYVLDDMKENFSLAFISRFLKRILPFTRNI